ncbi:hypothetical protein BDF14DRAFT_1819214 [Spinellus fusiger]|nr:hypothetical protein BDF14DRAFT_1819214 [Spinellus fusiger]
MSSEYGDDDTFFTEDIMRQMDEKELEYTQTQGMSTLTKEFASAVLHSQTRYIASSADYIPPPIATSASATSEEERRIKAQQFTIDRMQGKMAVIQAQKETADKLSDEYIAKCNFQAKPVSLVSLVKGAVFRRKR